MAPQSVSAHVGAGAWQAASFARIETRAGLDTASPGGSAYSTTESLVE